MVRCIAERDYDKYEIPMAVRNLLGPNRKRRIFLELEKRHPCFSDEFSFDYSIKVHKRKFYLDVFVINKLKLMEYRKKSFFSYLGFRMESGNKRRKFKNDYYNLSIVIMFVLFIISGLWFGAKKLKGHAEIENIDSIATSFDNTETTIPNENFDFPGMLQELFSVVQEEQGKILYFAWNRDGLYENVKMKIKGVYPEKLETFGDGQPILVEYNDSIPEYDFVLNHLGNRPSLDKGDKKYRKFEGKDIRDYILNCNGVINKEKSFPVEFDFTCSNLNILGKIDEYLSETGFSIKNIQIKSLENNGFSIVAGFSNQLSGEYGSLCLVRDYENLFSKKQNLIVARPLIKKDEKKSLKLIGKISYEDGKKMCFYKDANGKMIKEMEIVE